MEIVTLGRGAKLTAGNPQEMGQGLTRLMQVKRKLKREGNICS